MHRLKGEIWGNPRLQSGGVATIQSASVGRYLL